jgi:hypothetical protein
VKTECLLGDWTDELGKNVLSHLKKMQVLSMFQSSCSRRFPPKIIIIREQRNFDFSGCGYTAARTLGKRFEFLRVFQKESLRWILLILLIARYDDQSEIGGLIPKPIRTIWTRCSNEAGKFWRSNLLRDCTVYFLYRASSIKI